MPSAKRKDYRQIVIQKGELVVSLNRSASPEGEYLPISETITNTSHEHENSWTVSFSPPAPSPHSSA